MRSNDIRVIKKSNASSYTTHPKAIGATMRIKYNKDDVTDVIFINDNNTFKLILTGLGALFVILSIVGTVMRITYKKNEQQNQENQYIDNQF